MFESKAMANARFLEYVNRMFQNLLAGSVHQITSSANTIALQLRMGLESGSWGGGGWGWGFGFLWPLLWLIVLAATIGIVMYFLTRQTSSTNANNALVVLRERYARGEIEDEEFEERASRLRDHP